MTRTIYNAAMDRRIDAMGNTNRIKDLRKQAGLTQGQIGQFLKVDQSMVAKLESGDRNLTTVQLNKLSNLFGCSEEYLMGITGETCGANLAFRIDNMGSEEMEVVAAVNKIAANLRLLNYILENKNEE